MSMLVGVHEDASPAATKTRFPGATWTGGFVSDKGEPLPESTTAGELVAKVMAKAKPALDAGGSCLVRVKLDVASVGAGLWDDRLTVLGRAINDLNIIVVLNHEPENDWTGQTFATGFNRGRKAIRAGGPDVQVAYAAMAYQWRPGSKTTQDSAPWRSVEADWWLIDCYSGVSFEATCILPEHPGFARWYTQIVVAHPGRPWGVAERGIISGSARAATIARESEWLTGDPVGQSCGMYMWWNTPGSEGNAKWLLDSSGTTALAAAIAKLAIPKGYEASAIGGCLVHSGTGVVVASEKTGKYEALLRRITHST